MPKLCNLSRGRMCYMILALSIVFFLSSVCTFAVLAMTKQATERVKTKKGINKNDI